MQAKDIFPQRLKQLRHELNLSQKELAESIEISAMAISTYESGTKSPSIDTVFKISQKYNISIDWLCGLSDERALEIFTMSDVLGLLFSLEKVSTFKIFSNKELINLNSTNSESFDGFEETTLNEIGFMSGLLNNYIGEWHKMRSLYQDGTIDAELYSLWKQKVLTQTSCTYPDGSKIIPDEPE